MSTNGWGKGSVNNTNGWGAGAINNDIGWGDSQLKSWSGDTDLDGGTGIPVNTVAPVISGTTTLGSVLTTTNGTWTAKPAATFTYQWKRNGSNIIGATNSTYTLVNDDGATNITCEVTATNDFGGASANSNTLAIPAFTDADAQAFITAAAITDPTQQSAINQLVTDLKGYGVWTKMKAIYPFVGGTVSSHKFNLKDPRDLDAAFRLVFNGGWVHNSNGVTGNKINTFADTFLNYTTLNSGHQSLYSRSNIVETVATYDMGAFNGGNTWQILSLYSQANLLIGGFNSDSQPRSTLPNSSGLFINNRTSSNSANLWRNGVKLTQSTQVTSAIPNRTNYIGALNNLGTFQLPSSKNYAFASIGDGLTDTEAANFYTAVQTFQVTLGRSIGTQTVSDADAQAFVTNAGIVDQVEADAVNNLVIGLKADGLWSKMKAVYPFVGSSASSHKYNLKNPLDTDAAFRLVFNGGWTHSSTGALPNGTNAYADTFLIPSTSLAQNSTHLSFYSRTNILNTSQIEIGVFPLPSGVGSSCFGISSNGAPLGHFRSRVSTSTASTSYIPTDSRGLFVASRIISTQQKAYRNGILQETANINSNGIANIKIPIAGLRLDAITVSDYTAKQTAFASIGDGLTDTEAANFYTAVQTFNTALNRQV